MDEKKLNEEIREEIREEILEGIEEETERESIEEISEDVAESAEETQAADEESEEAAKAAGLEKNKTRIMKMFKPEIDIAWMYPDTLYLHGERGNVMALVKFARELGLAPKVHRIDMGSGDFNPMKYDIIFYGPGEISSFRSVINDIGTYQRSIAEYLAAGKVMLVTGTTVAMFGERIRRFSPDSPNGFGEIIDGLCLIPAIAEEREYVFGDDEQVRAEYGGYSMELVGNQIQMADIEFLENSSFRRFGSVIYGRGNNGEDGIEGVVYNNAIFTNMLGPVLVGNPWLAVRLLRTAAELKGIELRESDPDYELEIRSLAQKKKFIEEKSEI